MYACLFAGITVTINAITYKIWVYVYAFVCLVCYILPGPLPPAQVVIGIEVDLQRSRDLEAGLAQRAKYALIRTHQVPCYSQGFVSVCI